MKSLFFLCFPLIVLSETGVREKLGKLHQSRVEIRRSVFEKSRVEAEIQRLKIEMKLQQDRVQSLNDDLLQRQEKVAQRASAAYKMHRAQGHGAILNLMGGHEFLRKTFYLNFLNHQDRKLMSEIQAKTSDLKKEKDQQKSRMVHFQDLKTKVKKRYSELLKLEADQRKIISEIKSDMKPEGAEVSVAFFSEKRGRLRPPTAGVIKGPFGLYRESSSKLNFLSTGMTLAAEKGREVVSVGPGEVIFAGPLEGWGATVVIDHGEFFYTVYSGIEQLNVRLGEMVIEQQKLAVVKNSSYDGNQGLYFEIRHFSEPQNPSEWLDREAL